MKMLKKLALVSAVSMISTGAFAMEALDEETMSATTGQDGITIRIAPDAKNNAELVALGVTTNATVNSAADVVDANNDGAFKGLSISKVIIHDDDGLTAAVAPAYNGGTATTNNSGALVIGSGGDDSTVVFTDDTTPIQIDLDMVGDIAGGAADAPMLNIAITTPTLGIKVGNIYVANSNATTAAVGGDGTEATGAVKIISGFEIVVGGSTTVIQLGNEAQGAMIVANTTLTGGLTINNFALYDRDGSAAADAAGLGGLVSGSIAVGQLKVTNNGTNTGNLNVDVKVDVVGSGAAAPLGEGLYVYMETVGNGTGIDVALNNVGIGGYTVATGVSTAAVIGDIQLLGLDVSGTTMIIRGH